MKEQEKDVRVHIVHLREELLLSEHQLFYRIYHALPLKRTGREVSEKNVSSKTENTLASLLAYKTKLENLKKSPFIFIVHTINLVHTLLFVIPHHLALEKIKREFLAHKLKQQSLPDIINFGVIPYNFRKLRQQHLAEELAKKGHRIFYIENQFTTPEKYYPGYFVTQKYKNVFIIKLYSQRDVAIYHQIPTKKEITSMYASLKKLMHDAFIKNYVVKIDHPFWTYLLDHLSSPVIYDCMDDYAGFEITGKHIGKLEKKLVKKCDLTLVCSDLLLEKIVKFKPKKTLLLKNACEYDHFSIASSDKRPSDQRPATSDRKTIGFFGALGEWVDDKLIALIAKKYPHASIVLIGEVQNVAITRCAARYKNIVLLGEKPYDSLPHYLRTFDVCIIPFKVNSHTTLIDPVKLYEYFASGRAVVSTAIEEIKRFEGPLYYSHSPADFIENIKKALSENSKNLKAQRQKIAYENTWERRAEILHEEIQKISK